MTVNRLASLVWVAVAGMTMVSQPLSGQQPYQVAELAQAASSDALEAELAGAFASTGYRVTREGGRTLADIWLSKQLPLVEGFSASEERLYPFESGQLIGLVHFPRRATDFRNQAVPGGWYTLRFELQPIDGNHEGTSIIRDFLVLVAAGEDAAGKRWDSKSLGKASGDSIESAHPGLLALQPTVPAPGESGADLRHDEQRDWWILDLPIVGDQAKPMTLSLVIVGHADE